MTKSILTAIAAAFVSVATFAPAASAGEHHHHHHHKKLVYVKTYSYQPAYVYVTDCKWVYHHGHYKKVCH